MRIARGHTDTLGLLLCAVALALPHAASAQGTWSIEPVLTLGSYDGNVTFGSITGIAVRPSGEILVLDRMEGAVLVFDAEGTKLGQIGKKGGGPGELSDLAMGIYLTDDGALVIPDFGNTRVSFFNRDHSFAHSFRLDMMAGGMAVQWATRGEDQLLKQVQPMPSLPGMPSLGPSEAGIMTVSHDGTDLGMVTTFGLLPAIEMAGGKMRTRLMPEVGVWTTTSEGMLVVGTSSAYRLEVRDAESTLVSEITREVRRRAVTPDERTGYVERFQEQMARMNLPPGAADMFGDPILPDSLPVISGVLSGPNGTIMVQRGPGLIDAFSPEGQDLMEEDAASQHDILDLRGDFLGVLELPPRFMPHSVRGSLVYGVAKDEFDVETVVVYQVTPPGR